MALRRLQPPDGLPPISIYESRRVEPGAITSPSLIDLANRWEQARGTRRFPTQSDFPPESHWDLVGRIHIAEAVGDPPDFRFILFGSKVAYSLGFDMTGRLVSEVRPDGHGSGLRRDYAEAVAEGKPVFALIRLKRDDRDFAYERIILPLANAGGAKADHVLVTTLTTTWNQSADFFAPPR
ncbi:MAG: PAS domain-containing protein [Alphaproteobacteria bacterium]|nr:PAS domain-containing protein [Alphaproteobacteria bacterium]